MSEPVHFEAVAALADTWSNNWLWGLPIIVINVLVHCFGLANIRMHIVRPLGDTVSGKYAEIAFASLLAATALAITALHTFEAGVWTFAYVALKAFPDRKSAMLYSLSAITSYGHAELYLEKHWQMMGALEALKGMMLFGLTTAALFFVLQNYAPWGIRETSTVR